MYIFICIYICIYRQIDVDVDVDSDNDIDTDIDINTLLFFLCARIFKVCTSGVISRLFNSL